MFSVQHVQSPALLTGINIMPADANGKSGSIKKKASKLTIKHFDYKIITKRDSILKPPT